MYLFCSGSLFFFASPLSSLLLLLLQLTGGASIRSVQIEYLSPSTKLLTFDVYASGSSGKSLEIEVKCKGKMTAKAHVTVE